MTEIFNKVSLVFDIALILKQVQLRSIYTGSRIKDNTGVSQLAETGITDSELDIANISLRDAAHELYEKLQAFTRKSGTPFIFDTVNPITQKRNITYELWLPETWDKSHTPGLTIACEKYMVSYCLVDWFNTIGLTNAMQIKGAELNTQEGNIKSILNYRKEKIRRPYNTI